MSDAGGKKTRLWGGMAEYEETPPNARAEAIKAAIDAGLTSFERHKGKLLAVLRNAHERGPRSKPFDPDKTWSLLNGVAQFYFWRGSVKQDAMPAADRARRLRELAKVLGRARHLVDKAMQDDVKGALFSAWYDTNVRYDVVPEGPLALVRIEDEFDKVVAGLSALETAARRAVDDVRMKAGRPKGTAVLQKDDIEGLAAVYRESTGSTPGAGDGSFAKFVMEVLTALGRHLAYESVIDAIKDAGLRALMTANWEGPSRFGKDA
jgi:hypothetical protein